MPRYDVHIYPIARLTVRGVQADSPQEAIRRAEESVDLYQMIAGGRAEYAEDIEGFLVDLLDETGQPISARSVFLDPQQEHPPDRQACRRAEQSCPAATEP